MKRLVGVAGVLLLGTALALAQNEKLPTIKDVMVKLNKGDACLKVTLARDLKAEQPDWGRIQKEAKEFVAGTEALCKNEPRKGDKDSWTKLTRAYFDEARSLETATQKKDRDAAQAAQGRLEESCRSCHSVHRPG